MVIVCLYVILTQIVIIVHIIEHSNDHHMLRAPQIFVTFLECVGPWDKTGNGVT